MQLQEERKRRGSSVGFTINNSLYQYEKIRFRQFTSSDCRIFFDCDDDSIYYAIGNYLSKTI